MPQEVIVSVSDEAVAALVACYPKWRTEHPDDKAFVEAVIEKRCEEECCGAITVMKQRELQALEASMTLDERLAKFKA